MKPRRLAGPVMVVLAAVGVAGLAGSCSRHSAALRDPPQSSVTIAVEAPMSGPEAAVGHDILSGVRLAISQPDLVPPEASSRHRAREPRILVVVADDEASPARGMRVAEKLVARHVTAVIGPYDPPVASAVLGVYAKAKVAVLDLSPAASLAGRGVSVVPGYDRTASVEAQELVEVLGATSVAVLYDQEYAATDTTATRLRSLLDAAGVKVPVFEGLVPGQSPATAVAQVAAARTEAWYLAMPGAETEAVSEAGTSAGLGGRCLVDLVAGSGPFAHGCLGAGLPDVSQMPGGDSYSRAFTRRFHTDPRALGAFAYDSARLLIAAALKAGSWRFGPLTSALAHAGGIKGVTGDVTMDPTTGLRVDAPVVVLDESVDGTSKVDPHWAAYSGYPSQVAGQGSQNH